MTEVGFLGVGNHAIENLLPAIFEADNCKVKILIGRNREKIEYFTKKYCISEILILKEIGEIENIIKNIDALIISAPAEIHEKALLLCAKHNKPVFTEKPPAESLKNLENIIEANKNNVIQFGFNFRHSDMFIKLQEEMELDEIKYLHITSYAAKPQSRMWNCRTVLESSLLASHIHAIEMVCYILGEIKEISRKISWIDDKRFIGTILLKNKEGRVGVIDISNLHNKFEFNLESVDSKNKHFIAQNFNHIKTYDDVFIDKNNKSNISYDIPFLRGGFSRTGYSREFDNFAKNISLKKSDDKALTAVLEVYKIIERIKND